MITFTPPFFAFPAANSAISAAQARAFENSLRASDIGVWSNYYRTLSIYRKYCGSSHIGKSVHIWKISPPLEAWNTVLMCTARKYKLSAMDLPDGSNYFVTIGDDIPLSIHTLANLFSARPSPIPVTLRASHLWTPVTPFDLTHDITLPHFSNQIP